MFVDLDVVWGLSLQAPVSGWGLKSCLARFSIPSLRIFPISCVQLRLLLEEGRQGKMSTSDLFLMDITLTHHSRWLTQPDYRHGQLRQINQLAQLGLQHRQGFPGVCCLNKMVPYTKILYFGMVISDKGKGDWIKMSVWLCLVLMMQYSHLTELIIILGKVKK